MITTMKKPTYTRCVLNEQYEASLELALLIRDHFDFIIHQYEGDSRYADILTYENPDSQKLEFRRRKLKIRFDYIDIQVWYGRTLLWHGLRINHYFLVQLHYLSNLKLPQSKKFLSDLRLKGMNQTYLDYVETA